MKQHFVNVVESIDLNQAEATLVSYALEELMNSDDNLPFDQISELLTKFEKLANNLKQNKY
jgi:hypothetical protein